MANENSSERKSLGIVKWFGGTSYRYSDSGRNLNYGFVRVLVNRQGIELNREDIYLHKTNLLPESSTPYENRFVIFNMEKTPRGIAAVNAMVLDSDKFIEQVNFADAAEFRKIYDALKSFDASKLSSFLSAIPESFCHYDWVFEKLPSEKKLKFFLVQFAENPTPQLEEKIFDILGDLTVFRYNWRNLPDEILLSDRLRLLAEKLTGYTKTEIYTLRNQKFAHNALNSAEILSAEQVLKLFDDATNEDKFIAFEKYCDKFSDKEIFSVIEELIEFKSVAEIVKALREKFDVDKIQNILMTCTEKDLKSHGYRRQWVNYFFDAEKTFPTKFILTLWSCADTEKKIKAFEKYCTKFTDKEFANCVESLLHHKTAAEVVEFIKMRRPDAWQKLVSKYILNSKSKGAWATWLLDNLEIFRDLKADEGVAILVMYAAAKEDKISKELLDILETKTNADKALRAKIVYDYFRAGHEKNLGNVEESQKYLNQAELVLIKIFDMLAENPAGIPDLTLKDANIFPQCTEVKNELRPCFFCEAVPWRGGSYCPRLGTPHMDCARNFSNLNLPAEDWALGELLDKFDLKIPSAGDKSNGEYFSRIGGEFNRLYELRGRLKCSCCGEFMRSDKNFAKWKDSANVRDVFNKMASNRISHFAIFNSTVFRCQNPNCKSPDVAYLSYCWHCQEIIDSRDGTPRIGGWYLCPNCGAGYRDIGNLNDGYAIFPATICPHCTACTKCGCNDFDIAESENGLVLQCKKCGHLQYVVNTLELQPYSRNKYDCEVCGHMVQINVGRKMFQLPMPWADYYDENF